MAHAAETIAGLQDEIKTATTALIEAKTSTVSVSSGCELFVRSISLTSKMGEEEVNFLPYKNYVIELLFILLIGFRKVETVTCG